ncbi:ROK family transcriptional regulator [Microbacterium hydrocarbonoxydans]|uniref:ROK family transcriptional regulator n=1 Tax=Microbacterium hydrocarbonoxydans TaxID=273678 RepID=UPI00203C523A|nr:ROK family transcriptional regulator [Microbacterium hydrocarbonoxydans]MCM3780239.1 ROK family transcriptional regulator [Microbacterium hydrocarbonoxydans]
MPMRRGTNLPRMGDFNQSVILEAIRRSVDGLSRIELVEATGLSAQTVTNITRRLLDDRLIAEAGRTINGPGKPRITLRLVPESRFAVGVHLDPAVITAVLLDMSGAVRRRRSVRTSDMDPGRIAETMAGAVDAVIADSAVDRRLVSGVGIAVPGPLDAERGTVIDPPKLQGWHRVPLRAVVAEASGLEVMLEKDTVAAAVGEQWTGRWAADGSFVFVYLGTGIGAALVRDGDAIRGSSRNFGEIGHIVVDPGGPECACGLRGCVDVVCTPQAIVERAERDGLFPDAVDPGDLGAVEERFTRLCDRASEGEPGPVAALEVAAAHLAVLISVLTDVLDVDRVVLGGPYWVALCDVYLRLLPEMVHHRSATRALRSIPIDGTVVGADVGAVGAACVVLDAVLTPRASDLYLSD